ncbi:MAG TPA: S8 family serine peptidase [Candidatus Sulfotelmatobacter sp.]|nr:S8 family serine peptidase [Candidatus Sulfotelmatobacter sp.]
MSTSKSNVEKGPNPTRKRFYLSQQKRQYLIASRPAMSNFGLMSVGSQNVANLLKGQGIEFEPVKSLQGRSPAAPLSTLAGVARGPEILVARLNPEQGEALRLQSANGFGQLIVEHDSALSYGAVSNLKQALIANSASARLDSKGLKPSPVRIQIVGVDDKPVPGVTVLVFGVGLPSQGVSDDDGHVELPLYTFQPGQAEAVVVKPRKDYWDLVLRNVELRPDMPNVIQLRAFSETLPRYNKRPFLSWGQEFMMQGQMTQVNGSGPADGHGVKIAIIDSGCDNTHPSLQHITSGIDVTDGGRPVGWTLDPFSHGTHCAGIIAARPARGSSMRGFAPGAEIHVFKIFPGGRFSDLIGALDQCIEQGIDLVNLSVGADEISFLVEQKIMEARQCGIACIAAAGNTGGDVQYPARSPHVLAVAAIGRQSDFPMDSSHALTITGPQTLDGTFSPNFTCHGPEVGVCAPGVAIISTVPGDGFDVMDGTSVAAPHVTGLAAILLAHHPAFKSGLAKQRSAVRVEILFELVKQNALALPFLGADRTGAGLPILAAFNADAFSYLSALRGPPVPQGFFMQPNPFLSQPMGLAA